jgi:hypothetical protein
MLAPGGALYLEVPLESARYVTLPGPAQRAYLGALTRLRGLRLLVDFCSVAARRVLGWVPPFGFLKLHEHINVFSERALAALAPRPGFSTTVSTVSVPLDTGSVRAIAAVVRRERSPV